MPEPTTQGHLRLAGVHKVYLGRGGEPVTALDNVTLDVPAGSFLAIVGRSGCGKSTLLRIAAGLVPASGGRVELDGEPVLGPPQAVRYVFQDYARSLLPWKTVAANVAFGLRHHALGAEGQPSRQVDELLELVGLAGTQQRYPAELSGGMQQRLAIARALAAQPRVLLMDEPFGAVDALSRAHLQDTLLRLWSELGLTVVFVTHDVDEAVFLADRVAVMHPAGRGVAFATDVALPRPRQQVATREAPSYLQARRRILAEVLTEPEAVA